MATHRDFYEDDEPIEEILAAREAGAPFVTEPPSCGVTQYINPVRAGVAVLLGSKGGVTGTLGDFEAHAV
jgi:hypothetical protein